jgi:hypothetical protein
MVDYVAVLRRTIDALPKNTPDIRERVYAKARQTVQSKLAMINPAPSDALIAKQMSGLETAIATVETDFAVALETAPIVLEADPLADILNGLPDVKVSSGRDKAKDASRDAISIGDAFSQQPEARAAVKNELPPQPATPVKQADAFPFDLPEMPQKPSNGAPFPFDLPDLPDRPRLPETATLEFPELPKVATRASDSFDDVFGSVTPAVLPRVTNGLPPLPSLDEPVVPPQFTRPARPKAKPGRILVPLLGLAVLAGAGALAWTERDRIIALLKPEQAPIVAVQPEAPAEPAATPAAEPAGTPTPATPAETAAPQKFTQRLNADGTEIDAGAGVAGGEQSVAQLEPATEPATPVQPATPAVEPPAVDAPVVDPATPPAETPAITPPAAETPVAPAEPAVPAEAIPVGQKAIFYEERTSGNGTGIARQ